MKIKTSTYLFRIIVILGFLKITNTHGQYRFIKAHSDQEDRLIGSNFELIDPFRINRQSKQLINPLITSDLRLNEPFPSIGRFSQKDFNYFLWNNPEFGGNHLTAFTNKKLFKKLGEHNFLINPNRFFAWESEDKEDYLVVNPIIDFTLSPPIGPFDTTLYNGRGVEVYGQMGDKLAFHSQLFDYQASYPVHIDQFNQQHKVIPGIGRNGLNSFGFDDYFYATAYMDVLLLKKRKDTTNRGYQINASIGHDKQHIGSGFRSLILSNNAAPTLFLQVNYRLGPFRYQNLYKELVSDMTKDTSKTFNKKYLAMHRGSLTFEKIGLELGFSEMVIQTRANGGLDINYLNPVIFYRAIERDLGSPDNAMIAFDAKWNKGKFCWYGQLVIDEFNFSAVFNNRNSYLNKFGNQLGVYFRPNISNFKSNYFQLEYNAVRPFTYSHRLNSSNYYSHYNQSLAHPLESNFREIIFRFFAVPKNYQRISLKSTAQFAWKGLDKDGINFGGNIRKPYNSAADRENAPILQGDLQRRLNIMTTIGYYLQPNAKLELFHHWHQSMGPQKTNQNYLGISLKINFTDTRETYLF